MFQSSAVAAAEERKTKEEQIHTAIAGKIRKRDEDADDAQVVVVPRKDLLELKEVIPPEQWVTLRSNFHELTGVIADAVDELEAEKGAKRPRG